jgi:hypothetical protein
MRNRLRRRAGHCASDGYRAMLCTASVGRIPGSGVRTEMSGADAPISAAEATETAYFTLRATPASSASEVASESARQR